MPQYRPLGRPSLPLARTEVGLNRSRTVRALLVGGPMYDGLYERIPDFERKTGLRVEVLGRLPHPALNASIKVVFGAAFADIDLLSTHTKYAPSQAQWLSPIDDLVPAEDVADLLPRPAELSRIDGRLLQYPRNLDCRLLYYRRDLFDDPALGGEFERTRRRPLRVPETWDELVEVAKARLLRAVPRLRRFGSQRHLVERLSQLSEFVPRVHLDPHHRAA